MMICARFFAMKSPFIWFATGSHHLLQVGRATAGSTAVSVQGWRQDLPQLFTECLRPAKPAG
jgi:hypothetical protein